jgi:hypothetical protein
VLADAAASAMAAVVSEMAALPFRPAHRSSNPAGSGGNAAGGPGSSGSLRHSAAGGTAETGTSRRRLPPRPLPEQLAAAGYLADLTWVLEGAWGGPVASSSSAAASPAAGAPSAGLWAAHNALAAVAGWLEGSLQYAAGRPGAAATPPSATLQAAVARASAAMVGTAQRLLASGAGAGASGSSGSSVSTTGGYSSPVRGGRRPWRADSAPFRMACTGGQRVLSLSKVLRMCLHQMAHCAGEAFVQRRIPETCGGSCRCHGRVPFHGNLMLDTSTAGASILAGFCATSSLQLVAAQHGGAPAVAQALDIAVQVHLCTLFPLTHSHSPCLVRLRLELCQTLPFVAMPSLLSLVLKVRSMS